MKVAIVHEWLVNCAGSERVLEQIIALYPEADVFSVVDFLPEEQRPCIKHKHVRTTFIQHLPFAKKYYRHYLPLMPLAIEQLDLSSYDLILSSSHAVAKGIITGPDQLHISYVHSPIRYAWDLQHQYLRESGLNKGIKGWIARALLHYIRLWDFRTSNSVDYFVANSHFISRRIWKIYRREAKVIYPPVDIDFFPICHQKDDYYLTASRMVPYKKIDLIVEAFNEMPDKKLIVIGDGPDFAKIKARTGNNIELLGYQSSCVLRSYMQKAKAFVFAAEEDFGIIPVEAQACGTPVIAYGKGGVVETVRGLDRENPTGVFFHEQTVTALKNAIELFESSNAITAKACRNNSEQFSTNIFRTEFKEFVDKKYLEHINNKIIYKGECRL